MAGAFCLGRYSCLQQIIKAQFETFSNDSLGVYRLVDTDHYISSDKQLSVDISYIQFGESDSFYQLKLSTEREPYYGHINYSDDGIAIGSFCSPYRLTPIKYYNGRLDDIYIIIDNKKIPLTNTENE